jgi:hypothetical protein
MCTPLQFDLPVDHHFGFLSGGQDHDTQMEYCAATTRGAWTPGAVEPCVDLWRDDGPAYGENGTYSAFLYTHEALRNIGSHDLSVPMFMCAQLDDLPLAI